MPATKAILAPAGGRHHLHYLPWIVVTEGHIDLLPPIATRPKTNVAAAATTNEVSDAPSQEEAVGKPSHSPNKLVIHPDHHETVPGLIQL